MQRELFLQVNPGKKEMVCADGYRFGCYAIRTRMITDQDSLAQVVRQYAAPLLQPGDILFLSEKMVAITQGRARLVGQIHPSPLARLLSRFVVRTPHGIGLAMPETMQCALEECGIPRILLAAFCGLLGKLLGRRGWFYRVAGVGAAAVDGPCAFTLPPYDRYVVPAPVQPDRVAAELSKSLDNKLVLIVDINDLGGRVLGVSDARTDRDFFVRLLRQNPLGQTDEQTPIGVLRPLGRTTTCR